MKDQKRLENPMGREKLLLNRGVELILRKKKKQESNRKSNVILFQFGKLITLLKREINFYFEFSLDIRKLNSKEK